VAVNSCYINRKELEGDSLVVEPEEAVTDLISGVLNPMMSALRTLDECDSPGNIGAHLDLAIARLREHLGLQANILREHLGLQANIPPECSYRSEDLIVWLDTTSTQVVSC